MESFHADNHDSDITYAIAQAATMTTGGLPNDVINNLDPFALLIFIPICDQFVSIHMLLSSVLCFVLTIDLCYSSTLLFAVLG